MMLGRTFLRIAFTVALAISAVTVPACRSTQKAQPEMLAGDSETAHERHESGIDSHSAD